MRRHFYFILVIALILSGFGCNDIGVNLTLSEKNEIDVIKDKDNLTETSIRFGIADSFRIVPQKYASKNQNHTKQLIFPPIEHNE